MEFVIVFKFIWYSAASVFFFNFMKPFSQKENPMFIELIMRRIFSKMNILSFNLKIYFKC